MRRLIVFILLILAADYAWTFSNSPVETGTTNPFFHHTFKPNLTVDLSNQGGIGNFTMRTNSLGFRDSEVRIVPIRTQKKERVVFIGDSFTAGLGLPWESTFVGKCAQHFPEFDVLNAGVSSYSPSIYFRKIKWIIDSGYELDHVVVYLDISDVQDEAVEYREDSNGNIYRRESPNHIDSQTTVDNCSKPELNFSITSREASHWIRVHFSFSDRLRLLAKKAAMSFYRENPEPQSAHVEAPKKLLRSYWTVDSQIPGYGDLGVDGGINKERLYMDRFNTLLQSRGIKLSVAVYPWPDQLDFDSERSRQVTIWEDWCKQNRCAHFINHFPDFFEFKSQHADWRQNLFFEGDVHYSERGNALVAGRLISTFEQSGS